MLKNKHPRQRGQNFNEVPYQPSMKRYHLQGLGDELEGRFLLIRKIDELKLRVEAIFSSKCSINSAVGRRRGYDLFYAESIRQVQGKLMDVAWSKFIRGGCFFNEVPYGCNNHKPFRTSAVETKNKGEYKGEVCCGSCRNSSTVIGKALYMLYGCSNYR